MSTFTRMPRTQLLVVTSVIIVVASLFANVIDVTGNDSGPAEVGSWVGLSIFGIAVTALLLLVAVPRIPREQQRTAVLGLGVGAVATVLVFWSMLPFALGAAALLAARPDDDRTEGEGEAPATAGVLLALLAWVGAFVLCLIG